MRSAGEQIRGSDFGSLLLETEMGFRFGAALDQPVADIEALTSYVAASFPVIELADTGLFGGAKTNGVDLIAANSAASGILVGEPSDWRNLDLDEIRVTLTLAGEMNQQGRAGDVMNGQWRALLWLVNRVIELGYQIESGHIFITGAIGRAHPGSPGAYVADYGAFGRVTFDIE